MAPSVIAWDHGWDSEMEQWRGTEVATDFTSKGYERIEEPG